jgi:hypothetical protein
MEEEGGNNEMISWFGKMEIDQRILDAVNDDWRKRFYKLKTEQEVAEHIAFNWIVNRYKNIHDLVGWADMPNDVVCKLIRG